MAKLYSNEQLLSVTFFISMAAIGSFIAVVFIFIL